MSEKKELKDKMKGNNMWSATAKPWALERKAHEGKEKLEAKKLLGLYTDNLNAFSTVQKNLPKYGPGY